MKINKFVHEVIEEICKERDKSKKVDLLKKYECSELKQLLGYVYDPRVKFSWPRTLPVYAPMKEEEVNDAVRDAGWERLAKTPSGGFPWVYYLTDHGRGNYKEERLYSMWKSFLELVHPKDAKIFTHMYYKKPFRGLTRKIIEEAYPRLTAEWPEE